MKSKQTNYQGTRDYGTASIESIKEDLTAFYKEALRTARELRAFRKEPAEKPTGFRRPKTMVQIVDEYVGLFRGFASDLERVVDDINKGLLTRDLDILKQIHKKVELEEYLSRRRSNEAFEVYVNNEEFRLYWDQIFSVLLDSLFGYLQNLPSLIKRLRTFLTPPAKKVDYSRATKPKSAYKGIQLSVPPGTEWSNVWLIFLDKEQVQIYAGGKNLGVKDYIALGFVDHKTIKKDNKPTRLWKTLLSLAKSEDGLKYSDKELGEREIIQLRANISDLAEVLKDMFVQKESPFHDYRRSRSYKPKFKISKRTEVIESDSPKSEYRTDFDKDIEKKTTQRQQVIRGANTAEARNRGLPQKKRQNRSL